MGVISPQQLHAPHVLALQSTGSTCSRWRAHVVLALHQASAAHAPCKPMHHAGGATGAVCPLYGPEGPLSTPHRQLGLLRLTPWTQLSGLSRFSSGVLIRPPL